MLTRQDPLIDFNWDQGSPDPSVNDNNFSARWTKTQVFGAGRYKFTTVTDDGVRLYIDNIRVIDQWQGQSSTEWSYTADLGEGKRTIRMEYFDFGGSAVATLRWEATVDQPADTWHAEYWNMTGLPVIPAVSAQVEREELAIDHDWGDGSPAPGVINTNLFLARWTRTLHVSPGEYQFTATADDGVRLYVDGVRVMDQWIDQGATATRRRSRWTADRTPSSWVLRGGGGALARLTYPKVADLPDPQGWLAEYWNTPDVAFGAAQVIPTRPADLVRTEPLLENDWDSGSPAPSITDNFFMARWTRTDVLSAGIYRFTGAADDGIRIYVDNVPVVDMWQPQNAAFSVDKAILAGPHAIRVEYFENGGGARAIVNYQRISDVVAPDQGFAAEYFANRDLAGNPALTRVDPSIDFNWGTGSPDNGIPSDNFSVRWTKSVQFAAGAYTFTTTTDDGVRLIIDGVNVIDKWVIGGQAANSATRTLTGGAHQIVMEYFKSGGSASAALTYAPASEPPPPPPIGAFTAEYFANPDLAGTPALTRTDAAIDFDWDAGSPGPGIPTNNFSVRWTASVQLAAGGYTFTTTTDDGVRLYVDGVLVIDEWVFQSPTTHSATRALTEGTHQVVTEYFEAGGGAVARFSLAASAEPPPPPPPPSDPWAAEFFNNVELAGAPVLTRSDAAVDFDWGQGSPGPGVPSNLFSARWTKVSTFDGGTYRFTATGDDGIRVLLDGALILNGWSDHGPTTYTVDLPVAAGQHTIVVEYYESGSGAVARFSVSHVCSGPSCCGPGPGC